ncbi:ras-GEF domain-containing family member 1C isoform X1 [Anopheles sinensis]|uniref:Ras-GEF domain-containing family member 1C isoform X1 n=1 Tax=Anopheles sinensis TaxID=74873 RepID=A0A084WBA1_ANOSI|nr:ras-GEF domain-containing family member 1C isoform X1 [Anopheles sinensis]
MHFTGSSNNKPIDDDGIGFEVGLFIISLQRTEDRTVASTTRPGCVPHASER